MTNFRNLEGKNVYVKDFGTDKIPVGTILVSNITGSHIQLEEVAGRIRAVQNRETKLLDEVSKRRGF